MRALLLVATLILPLISCDFPRDPEATEAQVRKSGTIRLGVASGAIPGRAGQQALSRIERATGARTIAVVGDSGEILSRLAEGKIDLVFGHFPQNSPWAKEVHFSPALGWRAKPPAHEAVPRFVMRLGENRWIMTVEKASQP